MCFKAFTCGASLLSSRVAMYNVARQHDCSINIYTYSAANDVFFLFVTCCIPMRYKENAKKCKKKCIFSVVFQSPNYLYVKAQEK